MSGLTLVRHATNLKIDSDEKYKNHCFTCGGAGGKHGTPCTECGRVADTFINPTQGVQDVAEIVTDLHKLVIPNDYWGVNWSPGILVKDHSDKEKDIVFQNYVKKLDSLHSVYANGSLPSSSVIIFSPPRFSKKVFGYSCMQHALKNGYSVVRLLDTSEVKRVIVMASEYPKYKPLGLDYEDYVKSDVCFISVQKDSYKRFCWETIVSILDKRSRNGVTTCILSSYPPEALNDNDKYDEFMNWLSVDNLKDNNKKLPVTIKYF